MLELEFLPEWYPRRRRRHRRIAQFLIAGLVALVAGTWSLHQDSSRPTRDRPAARPITATESPTPTHS